MLFRSSTSMDARVDDDNQGSVGRSLSMHVVTNSSRTPPMPGSVTSPAHAKSNEEGAKALRISVQANLCPATGPA